MKWFLLFLTLNASGEVARIEPSYCLTKIYNSLTPTGDEITACNARCDELYTEAPNRRLSDEEQLQYRSCFKLRYYLDAEQRGLFADPCQWLRDKSASVGLSLTEALVLEKCNQSTPNR